MESQRRSNPQLRRGICYANDGKQQERSPSVIVIGGGMAGIAAARALQDASFQVVILESRKRLGGRIHTDYSFGFPVDLGASWLHGVCKENPLAPVIGKLGLPLYRTSWDNSVLYDHDLESYALFDTDGNQVPQELVTKVGEQFEIVLKEANKVRQEFSEDMSISRALSIVFERRPDLRLEGLAHKVLQWYLCRMEGWFAADADTISLKSWDQNMTRYPSIMFLVDTGLKWSRTALNDWIREILQEGVNLRYSVSSGFQVENNLQFPARKRDRVREKEVGFAADNCSVFILYVVILFIHSCHSVLGSSCSERNIVKSSHSQEELLPGGHGLMVRGYLPVINTLAKGLDIRLGHRVTKIVRRYNGVKVTVENGTIFVADAAVIAVPLGVLKAKSIKFEPKLPDWKEAAIADLGVGIENKIILHFENVFWPNVEFLGVVAETSYGCSYFLNLHKATGRPVLVYMPAGQLAKDIEKMSNEAAANFAFTQLKRILPDASSPIQYLVSRWASDVNSLGSYTYDTVGKPHDLYEKLRIPVDNLFFAGEATSMSYPGSVHGAFSTGIMAAEDCRMRVLERYGEWDLFQPVMGEEASVCVPLLISRL
ncbi:hypothetical protein L6164_029304 [Bauhinia variegata]|uniref:Uncharacterized protein n=1 Tax=Bauhinia variegata TaxID=167791 RepID=A0ACB9LA58_BAUVA|nr:hypothetical protein L6164_029304 [Bauhinia variegata]